MCGRTACTLDPEHICKAFSYRNKDTKKYVIPPWKSLDDKCHVYKSSTNIAPTEVLPVLVPGSQVDEKCEKVVMPMIWGMIPSWHKGDFRTHGLTTHNIRDDHLFSSKMYLPVYRQDKRCIVICDGFYEWQTTKDSKGKKQPYFVYMPQPEGVDISDPKSWNIEWSEEEGWKGPRLLALAGLYNVWISSEGEKVYSCAVFTTEPHDDFKYIHHRIPVVLETEEEIEMWLNVEEKSCVDVVALLKAPKLLLFHPVSKLVNNSRNKDETCTRPVDIEEPERPKLGASADFMESWLKRRYGSIKKEEDAVTPAEAATDESKRVKTESNDDAVKMETDVPEAAVENTAVSSAAADTLEDDVEEERFIPGHFRATTKFCGEIPRSPRSE